MFLRPSNLSLCTKGVLQYFNVSMRRNNRFVFKLSPTFSSLTFATRPSASPFDTESYGTTESQIDSLDDYLTSLGTNLTKIRKEIKLSKLNREINFIPIVVLLQEQCNLEPGEIGHMLGKRPRILLLNEERVRTCIEMLRDAGLKKEDVALMLKKSPGILTSKVEDTFDAKMNALYNLNVLPPISKNDVLKIIKRCPALLSTCSPESLQEKLHFMQKHLGFYRRQLRNMLVKQPSILTFSQENIKAKFDYCFHNLGMSIPDIARCPRVWQCSLKRLKERHLFLRHLGLINDNTHIDDFGLGRIITPADKVFAESVGKSTLVEFQIFAKKIQ